MSSNRHSSDPDHSLTWRRSSKCTVGSCVEVAITPSAVFIRDSKMSGVREQPIITVERAVWSNLATALTHERSIVNLGSLVITAPSDGSATIEDTESETTLLFDRQEWEAFRAGLNDGEFF